MSQAEDDARIKRIGELLDALKDPALPPAEFAKLERELDWIGRVRDPDAVGVVLPTPPEVIEYIAFVERLITRQGSVIPDFAAIHRRKAEIDRKFLNNDTP